jgi:hypothetical protein
MISRTRISLAIFSIMATVGICACAVSSNVGAESLSPRELYSNPNLYDGRHITVYGYITNGRCIYQSRQRYEQFMSGLGGDDDDFDAAQFDADAITIIGPLELLEHRQALSGKNAVVQGMFMANYLDGRMLDLHACGRAAVVLNEGDLRRLLSSVRANSGDTMPN